jgi:hypothetical protein
MGLDAEIMHWSKQEGCSDPGTSQAVYGIQCNYLYKHIKFGKRTKILNELSDPESPHGSFTESNTRLK